MKKIITSLVKAAALLSSLAFATPALAQATDIPGLRYWLDPVKQEVIFTHSGVLNLHWVDLKADDELWAMVSIEFSSQPNSSIDQAVARLRSQFPQYKLVRALINRAPTLRLKIPSLKIDREVSTLFSIDGPYYQENLMMKRSDAEAARKAYGISFLQLQGQIEPQVTRTQVIEQKTLDPSICYSVLPDGTTVLGFAMNIAKLKQRLETESKFSSTREQIIDSVLAECVVTPVLSDIHSYAALFNLKPIRNNHPGKIMGESRKIVRQEVAVPIDYQLILDDQS